jgi:hypothetical protein
MQACVSGYAHVSQAIWLNFTQETKKCFKLQEDELKLKILNLHDEALIETIKMDIWSTWFGPRTRKLWHFENAAKPEVPVWETRGSGFQGSDPNLSRDFHRILLGFSDSCKGLCLPDYIYVAHGRL